MVETFSLRLAATSRTLLICICIHIGILHSASLIPGSWGWLDLGGIPVSYHYFVVSISSVHTPSRFTLIVNLSLTIAIALHCMILHVRSLTIFCSRPTETLLGILFQSSTSFPSSSHCLFAFTLPLTRPILPIHCLPTLAFPFYTFSLPPFAIKSPELLPSNFLVGPCMQRRTPRPLDPLT